MVFLGGVGLEFCDGRTPFGLRRGTDAGMGSSRPRDRMLRVPAVMRGRTLAVAACFCSPLPADTTSRPVQVPLVVIAVILCNLPMWIEQHRQTFGLHAKLALIARPERQCPLIGSSKLRRNEGRRLRCPKGSARPPQSAYGAQGHPSPDWPCAQAGGAGYR